LDEMMACDSVDAILRCAVEIARDRIGMARVGIFLRDEENQRMRGTWGTDSQGNTVDEHFIFFDIWEGDKEYQERFLRNGVYWTVVANAPRVVHTREDTRVISQGWVACTPIRAGTELLGTMYNDAGISGASVDDQQQAQGAVLCSLLGTALDLARRRGLSLDAEPKATKSKAVVKAVEFLTQDPTLTAEALGVKLRLSASRMARVFKAEMGMSLVEYRNRLRLERFSALLDERGDNLLEAALSAGFGSYAQFHRVFLELRGTTPGSFLRSRVTRRK
jgi:AraC-like DNA-binding protein